MGGWSHAVLARPTRGANRQRRLSRPSVVVVEPLQAGPRPSRTYQCAGVRRWNGDKRTGHTQVDPHDHLDGVNGTQIPAIVHVDNGDVVADLADVSSRLLRIEAFHLMDECA